jgi:hypothetical protein
MFIGLSLYNYYSWSIVYLLFFFTCVDEFEYVSESIEKPTSASTFLASFDVHGTSKSCLRADNVILIQFRLVYVECICQ